MCEPTKWIKWFEDQIVITNNHQDMLSITEIKHAFYAKTKIQLDRAFIAQDLSYFGLRVMKFNNILYCRGVAWKHMDPADIAAMYDDDIGI